MNKRPDSVCVLRHDNKFSSDKLKRNGRQETAVLGQQHPSWFAGGPGGFTEPPKSTRTFGSSRALRTAPIRQGPCRGPARPSFPESRAFGRGGGSHTSHQRLVFNRPSRCFRLSGKERVEGRLPEFRPERPHARHKTEVSQQKVTPTVKLRESHRCRQTTSPQSGRGLAPQNV